MSGPGIQASEMIMKMIIFNRVLALFLILRISLRSAYQLEFLRTRYYDLKAARVLISGLGGAARTDSEYGDGTNALGVNISNEVRVSILSMKNTVLAHALIEF